MAVVEAQLAGLRLLLSRGIAHDPLLVTAVYRRLPLSSGPEAWAKEAIALAEDVAPSKVAQRALALAAYRAAPVAMDTALAALVSLHSPHA